MTINSEIQSVATSDESRMFAFQVDRGFPIEGELIDIWSVAPFEFEFIAAFVATSVGDCQVEFFNESVPVDMTAVSTGGQVTTDSLIAASASPMLEYRPAAESIIPVRGKFQCQLSDLSTTVEDFRLTIWCRRTRSNETGDE